MEQVSALNDVDVDIAHRVARTTESGVPIDSPLKAYPRARTRAYRYDANS